MILSGAIASRDGSSYDDTGDYNNDGASDANYHRSKTDYDGRGRVKRRETSGGTIIRYIYDERSQLVQVWKGADDTLTSGSPWVPGYAGSDANMKLVERREYDWNRNLTAVVRLARDGTDRSTYNTYDWRDRLWR